MIYQKAASLSVSVNLHNIFLIYLLFATHAGQNHALADEVEIVKVDVSCENQSCTFDVTLKHDDTGWEHYADSWRIVTVEGDFLGERILLHPHVNEQPFTRRLDGVKIPLEIKAVWVEAHDTVHGISSERYKVEL